MLPHVPKKLMVTNTVTSQLSIERIAKLLDQGRVQEAYALIHHSNQSSPSWQNAKGVCLLRLGMFDAALAVFRGLVFPGNCISVPDDVPALYRANFATALLLTDHVDGALEILEHTISDGHPYVGQFLAAVDQWKKSLSLLERMGLAVGWYSKKPFHLEFPPGGL